MTRTLLGRYGDDRQHSLRPLVMNNDAESRLGIQHLVSARVVTALA